MTSAAVAKSSTPILRSAAGEPPLGMGALVFRDDQAEMFLHPGEAYRVPATRLGVLELESGKWLAQPPGFHVDAPQFCDREAALRTAIARMIRKARKYMRNGEGEGTHWSEGYGGRVIEWALSLKVEKEGLVQSISEQAEAPHGHPGSVVAAKPYRISVQFSGGAASYVAAKLILDEFGHDGVALIFADTLIEDEDLYRFLDDAEQRLQHPIIKISEGRDPWTVFFDERMMGNSRIDPCSKILKRKLLDKWRVENCAPDCTLVIGYDASEGFRLQPMKARMQPVKVRAPLLEHGIWKEQVYAIVEADGLRLPRLYQMGFSHNNCGGFCVKAGHGSFALLLENLPERYAEHEAQEEAFRKFIGKDVSIMRDRRGGVSKPLTMRAFRERFEADPASVDLSDVGGCTCMEEPNPSAEDDADRVTDDHDSEPNGGLNQTTPSDPIVAELCAAHRVRKAWPAGHTFSMTNPIINGHMVTLGTCSCTETFSYAYGSAGHARMDAAIEAHWQKFDHLADKIDGRGNPINAEEGTAGSMARTKRTRRSAPKAGDIPELANAALPEPALSDGSSAEDAGSPSSPHDAGGRKPASEPAPIDASLGGAGEIQAAPIGAGCDEYLAGIMARDETPSGVTASPPRHVAEAGQDGAAGASASQLAYSLAPADPATDEGAGVDARSHAPPAFLSASDLAAEPAADWSPLLTAALDLAWREPPQVTEVQAALLDFGKVYALPRKVARPILRWHGGKWKLAPWIISHFPPHKVYIEPFGGAGSVLLQKLPAATEVWNDLEGEVVNLFSVLRNNAPDLARLIYLTPFSRQEYHSLYEAVDDPVERARQFVARSFMGQSSKGALRKSGFDSRINPDGFQSRLSSLRAMPEEFHVIAERFRSVVIESKPAAAIIDQYDRRDALFYVDPPYLADRANHYTHELDEAGHVALLERLRTLAGMAVVSGYRSELYDNALTDWRRVEIDAHADGGVDRTEVVWMNPACVAALDAQHPRLFDLASLDATNTPPLGTDRG